MRTIKIIILGVLLIPLLLFFGADITQANPSQIWAFYVTFTAYFVLLFIIYKHSNLFNIVERRVIKFERLANDKYYICAKIYGKEYIGIFDTDALLLSYERQPNNIQLENQVLHIIKIFGRCKGQSLKK